MNHSRAHLISELERLKSEVPVHVIRDKLMWLNSTAQLKAYQDVVIKDMTGFINNEVFSLSGQLPAKQFDALWNCLMDAQAVRKEHRYKSLYTYRFNQSFRAIVQFLKSDGGKWREPLNDNEKKALALMIKVVLWHIKNLHLIRDTAA